MRVRDISIIIVFFNLLTNPFQSVLIHPNIGDLYREHTELATWMGRKWPLDEERLRDRTLKFSYAKTNHGA
jgi:aromatic ring-cleaving dioxygenase